MRKIIIKLGIPVLALWMGTAAHATVTMTLVNATTYAENSGSFDAYLAGTGQIINGYDLIGIYSFNVSAGSAPSIATPFYTTCLSPAGLLDWGTHTYDFLDFAHANNGLNPMAWAHSGTDLWGIQNANYLFNQVSGQIRSGGGVSGQVGTPADQGAAMALAMYAALYNSTGYGALGGTDFTIPGLNGPVLTDYNDDINRIKGFSGQPLANGYVLRPNPTFPGAAQDMILLGSGLPQGFAVPEPTTVIAGALLLLPLGASALRALRKTRLA
jgi:hypothetical protein